MANVRYEKGREYTLQNGLGSAVLKAVLIDVSQYTVNKDTHQFLSDIPAGARGGITAPLTGVTFTNGVLDAADTPLPDLGGGTEYGALVLFVSTGNDATSPLLLYLDTGAGLPLTADGAADQIAWNASGIFKA